MKTSILFLVLFFGLVPMVSAQSAWFEMGDAPDGPNTFQATEGMGPISEIIGHLDRPKGDHVDTYAITITDPTTFYASTSGHLGGALPLPFPIEGLQNSRMWLWRRSIAREGVPTLALANDDDAFLPGDLASTISDPSSFPMLTNGTVDSSASMVSLVADATYLLSISTFDNDPEDAAGVHLAEFGPDLTALYGLNPVDDPPVGPFDHWENDPSTSMDDEGGYTIALRGAQFSVIVECDFDVDGSCTVDDLNLMLAEGPIAGGVATTPGVTDQYDLTDDGVIDLADRDAWLSSAGTANGFASAFKLGDANLDGTVDGQDFLVWNSAKFTSSLAWDGGDFTADGVVDGSDFIAWNANKFTSSDASAVPEPGSTCLMLLSVWGLAHFGRR